MDMGCGNMHCEAGWCPNGVKGILECREAQPEGPVRKGWRFAQVPVPVGPGRRPRQRAHGIAMTIPETSGDVDETDVGE